jgi:acetyl esterase/lipase
MCADLLADIRYGDAEGNLLDLHLPAGGERPAPILFWSGGSGWMRNDGKDTAAGVAQYFNGRGYAVAGVSIRSSAQATFPAQLEDIDAALGWLAAHGAEHGIDAGALATMGNSSGGWVATMAALATDHPVGAVVDLYGPMDFLAMDAHMIDGGEFFNGLLDIDGGHDDARSPESMLVGGAIGERVEACNAASPLSHVRPGAPPILIVHGQADPIVPHHQSELLFAALNAQGDTARFYSIPGAKHEHPWLADPRLADGYVVRETAGGIERTVADAPPPTWQTVGRFVDEALGRA